MRATIGRHDTATAPYVVAYRDPLSLVRELRARAAQLAAGGAPQTSPWRVPMLGKDVVVARVVDLTVDLPSGPRSALGFVLHPGGSVIAIDRAPPHAPLRLVQRLPEGVLEALLVEVGEEAHMPGLQDEPAPRETSKAGAGRKRPRRRRRSRGRG